jgi:serine O-acetyltransferase
MVEVDRRVQAEGVPAGGATARERWLQDRARYASRPWLRDVSVYAIALLRLGQAVDELPPTSRRVLAPAYWLAFRILEVALGIGISKNTQVGGGLRIHHFGGVFVNERSIIGAGCTLRQGVTIGSRGSDGMAPVIGDNVEIGAYAQVLGDVSVGSGASIGAAAVVLHDVPAGCIAVGNPAKILDKR